MKQYIIVGAAAAGIGAALALRRADQTCSITCITDEIEFPYNKCLLADYGHGSKSYDDITLINQRVVDEKNINLMRGLRVETIIPSEKKIRCSDNAILFYDSLLLAVGARPVLPPIDTLRTHPCLVHFYSLADVERIRLLCIERKIRSAVVIGAGLSGLECADVLLAQGIRVSIIERESHILPQQIDVQGAAYIEKILSDQGILYYSSTCVVHVEETRLTLSTGEIIEADMLVCATGVIPRLELAHQAGLRIEDGAIWVDSCMRTSDPFIYAAGDCARIYHPITHNFKPNGTWPEAMRQGMVAAQNMAGGNKEYDGAYAITSSSFFGVKFATCGIVAKDNRYSSSYMHTDGGYRAIVIDPQQDRLYGFVLVGDTSLLPLLRRLIATGESILPYQSQIINSLV